METEIRTWSRDADSSEPQCEEGPTKDRNGAIFVLPSFFSQHSFTKIGEAVYRSLQTFNDHRAIVLTHGKATHVCRLVVDKNGNRSISGYYGISVVGPTPGDVGLSSTL